MAQAVSFSHRLALAVRALDTTTGWVPEQTTFRFWLDGIPMRMRFRDGYFIALGELPEVSMLRVEAEGYAPAELRLRRAELHANLPTVQVPLLPSADAQPPGVFFRAEGMIPGLEALDGAAVDEKLCMTQAYNASSLRLTLSNPHNLSMNQRDYAVLDPDAGAYQAVVIVRRVSGRQYQLERDPGQPVRSFRTVGRLVYGSVSPDGACRFLARADGVHKKWILRCRAGEQVWFQTVDFGQGDAAILPPEGGILL